MFIIAPNWKQPKYFKNKALACLPSFLPASLPALNLVQNHQVGWSKAGMSVSVCRALVHLSTGWSQIREQRASVGTMAGVAARCQALKPGRARRASTPEAWRCRPGHSFRAKSGYVGICGRGGSESGQAVGFLPGCNWRLITFDWSTNKWMYWR